MKNTTKKTYAITMVALASIAVITMILLFLPQKLNQNVKQLAAPRVTVALPGDSEGNANYEVEYTKQGVRVNITPRHDLTDQFIIRWYNPSDFETGEGVLNPDFNDKTTYEWYMGAGNHENLIDTYHTFRVDVQAKKGNVVSATTTFKLTIKVVGFKGVLDAPDLDVSFEDIE